MPRWRSWSATIRARALRSRRRSVARGCAARSERPRPLRTARRGGWRGRRRRADGRREPTGDRARPGRAEPMRPASRSPGRRRRLGEPTGRDGAGTRGLRRRLGGQEAAVPAEQVRSAGSREDHDRRDHEDPRGVSVTRTASSDGVGAAGRGGRLAPLGARRHRRRAGGRGGSGLAGLVVLGVIVARPPARRRPRPRPALGLGLGLVGSDRAPARVRLRLRLGLGARARARPRAPLGGLAARARLGAARPRAPRRPRAPGRRASRPSSPRVDRSSVRCHSWRLRAAVRAGAGASVPKAPRRRRPSGVAEGRHEQPAQTGADRHEPQTAITGAARRTRSGPTQRHRQRHRPEDQREPEAHDAAHQSDGVRCWKSAWLGIMKTMFAMPRPNAMPIASAEVARRARAGSSATPTPRSRR